MDKAATLVEAINRFSPQPIEFGVDSVNESFYVKRSDDPLRDLRVQLLSSPKGIDKTLLAGHRGTGKSTELNRLGADPEIQRHFEVVRFSVKDSLELTDLDHVDLLFTMVARTYEALSTDEAPLDLKEETVASLEGWRSRVIERMEEKVKGAGGELSVGGEGQGLGFFGKLGARLRWERTTRESTRQVIQPRIQEFLGDVTDFFLDVQVALDEEGKRLLLLIEDLDKLPYVQQAKTLFGDMGKYLTDPPVRIVYTVPIALHYSKNFMQIAGRFGENVLVPNVRLASHDDEGRAYGEGIAIMRAFVAQRMDCSLIDDDALAEAVTLGGGLFQQMQRVMQKACVKAVGREMERVTKAEVLEGASDLRAAFERPLTREDISILDDASVSKQVSGDDATLELLHSLHLMEYRNAERWCDVNPLLRPTLKRWGAEARSKSKAKAK